MTPDLDRVIQTWAQYGRKIRSTEDRVILRTDPPPQKVGSIFLSPKQQSFWSQTDIGRMVVGTVLAVGPKVSGISVGDRVVFDRLHFAWLHQFAHDDYIGYVKYEMVLALADGPLTEGESLQVFSQNARRSA